MLLEELLTLLRCHVGPALAQLVSASTSAMAMVVMMTTEADITDQQPAKHHETYCLQEAQRRQPEDLRHQPIPQTHNQATQQRDHHHEEEWDEYEMFLQYCHFSRVFESASTYINKQ